MITPEEEGRGDITDVTAAIVVLVRNLDLLRERPISVSLNPSCELISAHARQRPAPAPVRG